MAVEDNWFGGVRGAVKEAEALHKADAKRRQAAQAVILSPKDLQGNYDAARLLQTTLGGELRQLTADDLIAFQKNIKTARDRFKKGVTARQVIDLSFTHPKHHKDGGNDLTRAKKEIHHAIPTTFLNGVMRFTTNAGPDHGAKRHFVSVRFLSFGAAVAMGKDPQKAMLWLRKEPLAFDCDCGRHTFWFRYIATIGGFNEGRSETGFPKEKNPGLQGIACKHVLRVMSEIDQGAAPVALMLKQAITKAQAKLDGQINARVTRDAKEAEKQARSKGKEVIKTTEDHQAKTAQAKARKAAKEATESITKKPKVTIAQRRIDSLIKQGILTSEQVAGMKQLGISDELIATMRQK